ncbi:MAG: TldD/PmbA family protein [bacterium]|nr:TldD/PmbA family protein [bacterium]
MTSAERERIAKRALAASTADQTEVIVSASDAALMRFTRGISNQNVAATDRSISVRAIVGGRTGVASTNETSDAAIDAVVARAIALAAFAPSDPMQPTLPSGAPTHGPENAYVDATAQADPFTRAHIADAIVAQAEIADTWGAGYVATSASGVTIANSSGALASFDGTDAQANVKVTADDSSGFAEHYATDVRALDGHEIGRRAVTKARESARPRAVEPGAWTVILEPPAFGELLTYLISHFSAQSYDEGSSFFAGKLGEKFFADGVTIRDDYAHPLAPGMPFDFEAQPKARPTLVERGVVREIVTDSYYAHKLGRANTGHALPAPNAWGPQALNIVVDSGTSSVDDLITQTERGLLVSRFWYIRTVDQKQAIVTGMTRDGTFLIEHGRIVGGVRNLRFNQSIVEALAHAVFASDAHRTGGYGYSLVVPTAKIDGFRFTSTTEF